MSIFFGLISISPTDVVNIVNFDKAFTNASFSSYKVSMFMIISSLIQAVYYIYSVCVCVCVCVCACVTYTHKHISGTSVGEVE